MNRLFFPALAISAIVFTACSSEIETAEQKIDETRVTFTIDEFLTSESRSNVNPANNYAVTWAEGDKIGIFPREGYQEPFEIPVEQVGLSKATFDGGYWALKEGLSYNAYYPFDKANFESADAKKTIPVSYVGQSQNGTTCNAGEFDYTYSDWTTATLGSINFKFHHLGAFLVIKLRIPATTTYTSLTLKADGNVIPTQGTYDLTAATPAFVGTTFDSSLPMNLNYNGTADETATFYMMMPPVNLSSSELMVNLSTGTSSCTYEIPSQNIQAAHKYEVEGTPKESDVSGTIDGWVEEEINEFDGHEYVDLGLPSGTLWATCNVGADTPEAYGNYYAWGEITGYDEGKITFNWSTYKYSSNTSGDWMTKYNSYQNLQLEAADDVATVNWGANWCIPSKAQFEELIAECTWTWDATKSAFVVTSKTNSKEIVFSLGGQREDTPDSNYGPLYAAGKIGYYWANTTINNQFYSADGLAINKDYGASMLVTNRYRGRSVRPVVKR